ncbi:hypothetical protein C1T28_13420 [Bacillus subtilis]|nr:hypothetical protein C1T25_02555 [Bacillus cereus]POO73897.1 hypothetical protein C1T28_13420 [Bacillus subtilis]
MFSLFFKVFLKTLSAAFLQHKIKQSHKEVHKMSGYGTSFALIVVLFI